MNKSVSSPAGVEALDSSRAGVVPELVSDFLPLAVAVGRHNILEVNFAGSKYSLNKHKWHVL